MEQKNTYDLRAALGGDGAIRPVLEAMKLAGATKVYLGPGNYTLDAGFDMGSMWFEAHPQAVIAGTGAKGGANALLSSTGYIEELPRLSSGLKKGDKRLIFEASHGLAAGDVFILYNPTNRSWSNFSDIYRAGEWCDVGKVVSPTVVELTSPLYADYAATGIDVFKAYLNRPAVTGGQWFVGNRYFCNFRFCAGGLIDVPFVDAECSTAINLDRCWSPVIRLGSLINRGNGSSDDYGVSFGNSQHGRLYAKSIYGRRHAVAHGGRDDPGAVPCRDCLTFGASLTNDITTGVETADIHGNAEQCGFVECHIVGGAKLGGLSPIYRDCIISARRDGCIVSAAQFCGGTIDLRGMTGSTHRTTNLRNGFISIIGNSDALTSSTKADVNLILIDARIAAPNITHLQHVVRIENNGYTGNVNIDLDRIAFDFPAVPVEILRTGLNAGVANSQGIVIDNVTGLPTGSKFHVSLSDAYTDVPHRLMLVRSHWEGVTSGAALITSGNFDLPYEFPRVPTEIKLVLVAKPGVVDKKSVRTNIGTPFRAGLTRKVINLGIRPTNNAQPRALSPFRLTYTVGIRDF